MTGARSAPAEPPRQGHLRGPSAGFDRRVHAVRSDLADIALADSVIAPRYAAPVAMVCATAQVMLRAAPDPAAPATSALLWGESFQVFDRHDGWAWGQCGHDRYVGYVPCDALAAPGPAATHGVDAPAALVFAAPDIKSPLVRDLPFNARLAAVPHDAQFVAAAGGFVHLRHLRALDLPPAVTPLAAARLLLGSPYLWGGRTRGGIDCSGLVQAALMAAGLPAPRDSDQQADQVGTPVDRADRQPGDLLFVPGHVGIIETGDRLLHANAFWMQTCIEPLADVLARLPAATEIRLRRPAAAGAVPPPGKPA